MTSEVQLVFHPDEGHEAKGVIRLVRFAHGANLFIDGIEVGAIDLYPCLDGNPPQLVIDNPITLDDPFAKVVFDADKGGPHVVVNGRVHEEVRDYEHTLAFDDHVYKPDEPRY